MDILGIVLVFCVFMSERDIAKTVREFRGGRFDIVHQKVELPGGDKFYFVRIGVDVELNRSREDLSQIIARLRFIPDLRYVCLMGNGSFTSSGMLKKVAAINPKGVGLVGRVDWEGLRQFKNCQNLTYLVINNCTLANEDVKYIKELKLKKLLIIDTRASEKALTELVEMEGVEVTIR